MSIKKASIEVRILVYGQSISEQLWWLKVKQHLRETFADARLVMENLAIGGFQSTRLLQCAVHDARLFSPDLILFHDYGPERDYEAMIRTLGRETTAEIAVQTDHVALEQERIAPQLLLHDTVHLNDEGNDLLFEIVRAHLTYDPAFGQDPQSLVTTLRPEEDFEVTAAGLTVSFEGNRVDLVANRVLNAEIELDGVRPGSLLGSYVAERP